MELWSVVMTTVPARGAAFSAAGVAFLAFVAILAIITGAVIARMIDD